MLKHSLSLAILTGSLVSMASVGEAQCNAYFAQSGGDWGTASDWNSGAVPTSSTIPGIGGPGTYRCNFSSSDNATVNSLFVGTTSVTCPSCNGPGVLDMTGGTLTVTNTGSESLTVEYGGALLITNGHGSTWPGTSLSSLRASSTSTASARCTAANSSSRERTAGRCASAAAARFRCRHRAPAWPASWGGRLRAGGSRRRQRQFDQCWRTDAVQQLLRARGRRGKPGGRQHLHADHSHNLAGRELPERGRGLGYELRRHRQPPLHRLQRRCPKWRHREFRDSS